MRLFIGIPLAAAVMEELSTMVARQRRKEDGLRWTAAESWHITLQFLGEASAEQYQCLVARVGEVRSQPVSIQLAGLGFFERTGVFFAGVAVNPQLLSLQRMVATAASWCGFSPETRTFHPHIKLARSKGHNRDQGGGIGGQSGWRELRAKVETQHRFSRFVAQEFNLYESFLGLGGARYEIRERFPLNAR
jgi:2'-5' RNA ligase